MRAPGHLAAAFILQAQFVQRFQRRGGRQARVNTQRLARTSDLLGHVRFVTFLPEDLDIVKRGPGYRRDFLDSTAVQLWPGSHLDQADFDRALRQRNAFLKQGDRDDVTLVCGTNVSPMPVGR